MLTLGKAHESEFRIYFVGGVIVGIILRFK